MFDHYAPRLNVLRHAAKDAGLDAVAIVPGKNLLYLTNVEFRLMLRPIIAIIPAEGQSGRVGMIVPELEVTQLSTLGFDWEFFTYNDTQGYHYAFERALPALGLAGKKIGVEAFKMRVAEGKLFEQYAPGCTIVAADEVIGGAFHLKKDAIVVEAIRTAIRISEKSLTETLPHVKVGMTEHQIEKILNEAMERNGSHGKAFEPIVTAGENTALPHAHASDRVVNSGEFLLFDFGASYDRYPADITRTFVLGEPTPEMIKIYQTVLAANEAGIRAARPGATGQDVDRAARSVIEAAGYGQYFTHRTGHGLGVEGHEPPYMREGDLAVLEPGMTFTVEPGIYITGMGGVRIEDNLLITETGVEVLTNYPKHELVRVG